jgi:hypothetical protein
MKPAARWLIAAALILSPGCVKPPDWIETTLVTADVTGVWEGTVPFGGGPGGEGSGHTRALFDLEQEGPKVKGKLQIGGATSRYSGPLEGRVGGDVFHFGVIGGQGERLPGEMTVSGDEMEGTLTIHIFAGPRTVRIFLRRVASPPRPQADRP